MNRLLLSCLGAVVLSLSFYVVATGAQRSTPASAGNGGPTTITVGPPRAVREAGGRRFAEFKAGRTVAAASGCLACHRIGAQGHRRPGRNLTYVGSRLTRSAIARALVASPAPMPSFRGLPEAKRRPLVTFLSLLRQ